MILGVIRQDTLQPNVVQRLLKTLAITALPACIVALLYYLTLGHRRDYLGHFAAGFGGTLSAGVIALAAVPAPQFHRLSPYIALPVTLVCIAAGGYAEATVFRLAKFDEVDFCNQNIGAVLAGLTVCFLAADAKPADYILRSAIGTGASFLILGGYFAVT